MDSNSAERITTSGFYIVDRNDHSAINYKTLSRSWSSTLILYGCITHQCQIYTPEENSYYFDQLTQNILKYENGLWHIIESHVML